MSINRRDFLWLGGCAMTSAAIASGSDEPVAWPRAILFDAFPIFDPRPLKGLVERHVHESPGELHELWRSRIFEHQWLRALSGAYADFETCVAEALVFASETLNVALPSSVQDDLVGAFSNLPAWDDVAPCLAALARTGARIGLLSNMSRRMLQSNLAKNALADRFDVVVSTDSVRTFKPDPRAYELGCAATKLARRDILFVAFAGWDVAGGKWFGFPTYWVNPAQARPDFAVRADGEGTGLRDLVAFVEERRRATAARAGDHAM